jgi:hypothetical protein
MGAYIQTLDAESDGLRKFLINSNDGSLNETNYKKLGSAISEYESLHGKNSKISNIFNDLVGGFQTGAANNKIALKGLITDLKHNPEVREALESSTRPGASLRDFLNSKEELKGMGTTFENFGKSLANKESVMADLSNKHQKSVDYFEAKEKAYNQRKTDFEMSRNQTKSSTQKGFEKFQNTANADFFAHEKLDNISEVNIRNEDFRGYKAALDKKGILNKPAEAVKFINEQLTKKRDFILNLAKTANVEADYKRFGGTLKLDNDATKKLANASSTGIKSGNQSTKYKELVNNRVNKLLGPFNPGQDPTVHLKFEEKVKFLKSIDKAVPGKLSSTDSLINLLK